MKNLILVLLATLLVAGCSQEDNQQVAPPGTDQKPNSSGPFIVKFSATDTFQHVFKLDNPKPEGKVEYFVKTNVSELIEIKDAKVIVRGCAASNVSHQLYWRPDIQSDLAYSLVADSAFYITAEQQGAFEHHIYGLKGCTCVEIHTTLKK